MSGWNFTPVKPMYPKQFIGGPTLNSFDQTSLVLYVLHHSGETAAFSKSQILNVWSIYLHLGVNVGKYTIHHLRLLLLRFPLLSHFWQLLPPLPLPTFYFGVGNPSWELIHVDIHFSEYHSDSSEFSHSDCDHTILPNTGWNVFLSIEHPKAVWMTTCHFKSSSPMLAVAWPSQVTELLGETWNPLLVRIGPKVSLSS